MPQAQPLAAQHSMLGEFSPTRNVVSVIWGRMGTCTHKHVHAKTRRGRGSARGEEGTDSNTEAHQYVECSVSRDTYQIDAPINVAFDQLCRVERAARCHNLRYIPLLPFAQRPLSSKPLTHVRVHTAETQTPFLYNPNHVICRGHYHAGWLLASSLASTGLANL